MAPVQMLQPNIAKALQLIARRSCDAGWRRTLVDTGLSKASSRFFSTSLKKLKWVKPAKTVPPAEDSTWRMADNPDTFPPFKDGIDPSRKGGPPGGDEALRRGLGPDADNWRNWSPEKMEMEANYLMRREKVDLDSPENWVSSGFDYHDRLKDIAQMRQYAFWIVFNPILFMFGLNYWPDRDQRNWIQREAFLELARREHYGLPLIDPDYIPPEKMLLPSDEELEALGEEPIL